MAQVSLKCKRTLALWSQRYDKERHMTDSAAPLPRWDMTVLYPSLQSPEFEGGFATVTRQIAHLAALFDQHNIGRQPQATHDAAPVAIFDEIIQRYNDVLDQTSTLSNYLACCIAVDAYNTSAQAKMSELQRSLVVLEQLGTRFTSWIGSLDLAALCEESMFAHDHRYPLQRAQQSAQHLMTPAEEMLAHELSVSGGTAWKQLYTNVTSQMSVDFERDGQTTHVPMSVLRNAAYNADREVRRRAYDAELRAWQNAAVPLAAAINGIKGAVNTLSQRRGWESPLDELLFVNSIDRATLEVMFAAVRETLPDCRRYFRAKARALDIERLAWYDLFASIGTSATKWDYEAATTFIVQQFGTYSDRLSAFVARAFREQWIDAEPRPGKRAVAFCERLRRGESRISLNYTPDFVSMSILAHELGHAYHNFNLINRTALQSHLAETLAETASIFCATIIRQAALQQAEPGEQSAILDASLQGSAQLVVSVTSRFLFEQRELAIPELCVLMEEAQRETYGDGMDPNALHPYLWAAKIHYYDPSFSFYNYQYIFGLLFALGLYAQYQRDPETFKTGYDTLLSSTGLADAATLANQFGIDIRSPAFWRSSLAMIRADIDRFEQLSAPGTA
jgi:pepF/M3 family oligoendopeptidase